MIAQDHIKLVQRETFEVEVQYKGEILRFDATSFGRTAYRNNPFPLFAEINAYLSIIPQEAQDKMFSVYQRLHQVLMQENNAEDHIVQIRPLVTELYNCFDINQLIDWTRTSANVVFPSNMVDSFIEASEAPNQLVSDFDSYHQEVRSYQDRQTTQAGTREKTYIKRDYEELVAMTIAIRLMLPIWGEFLLKHSTETGTVFKEYYAGRLIEGSQLEYSAPFNKLKTYVTEIIYDKDFKTNVSAILDMLSSEDYPTWALFIAIVRKLTIGDVRGIAQTESGKVSHLVASIHQYIRDRIVKHGANFGMGNIKDKKTDKETRGDEESRLTVFEIVKHSMINSPGEEKEIEVFASNIPLVVKDLCPDLPEELLNESMIAVKAMENERIHYPQQLLTSTIIGPYLSTSAILFLDKVQVINLIGAFQAMLWYRGHKELACIISATELSRSQEMDVSIGGGLRSNIPKNISERLVELYPHRRNTGRPNLQKKETLIHDAIKGMADRLFGSDWRINIPESWRSSLNPELFNPRRNQLIIPFDIRTILAKFAILVARNKFPLRMDAVMDHFD